VEQLTRTALAAVRFPNAGASPVALARYRCHTFLRERQGDLRAGEDTLASLQLDLPFGFHFNCIF